MRENELLEHIYRRTDALVQRGAGVVVGPGDDCAVLDVGGGRAMLVTVDQLVEGRHYAQGTPTERIAHKSVARSVSDIAATGGEPAWGLATAVLPDGFDGADELFERMRASAASWGVALVGGDISSGTDELVLGVTVMGWADAARGPVLRSGAAVGDEVFVTGALGGAVSSGRHLRFEPRVPEARALVRALGSDLHAMIDLSDGLGMDLGRVARASGVGVEVELERVPSANSADVDAELLASLSEGEDYELAFCAAPGALDEGMIPGTQTRVTRIGRAVEGDRCVGVCADGTRVDLESCGFEHGRG